MRITMAPFEKNSPKGSLVGVRHVYLGVEFGSSGACGHQGEVEMGLVIDDFPLLGGSSQDW